MNKEKVTNIILAAVAMAGAGSIAATIYETKQNKKLNALYEEHLELSKQLNKNCTEMYDAAKSVIAGYDILGKMIDKAMNSEDEEVHDTEQV